MQSKPRRQPSALPLLSGAIFLLSAAVGAIGILVLKHTAACIACMPDLELALPAKAGICGAMLVIEVGCIAVLMAASSTQQDNKQEND